MKDRTSMIFGNPIAIVIIKCQCNQSTNVPLLNGLTSPLDGRCDVFRDALPVLIGVRQIILGIRIPVFCSLFDPQKRFLNVSNDAIAS